MKRARKRFRRQLILMFALVLLLTWSFVVYELFRSRTHFLEEANVRTNVQSQVFAEYSQSVIRRINEILLDMRADWNGNWSEFADVVRRRQEILQDISFQVAVIDKDGMMQFSNLSKPNEKVDLSQREHFRVHREVPERDALFISNPVKGKVSGKWSLQFTRPIFRQGKFDGVLVVSVSPEQFTELARKLNVSEDGAVTVLRDSGVLMARYPAMDTMLGKIVDTSFLTSTPTSGLSGNFRRVAKIDGVERVYGYFRIPEYQLTFLVGESVKNILVPYEVHRNMVLGSALIISLCSLFLFSLLFKALNARDGIQQQLSDREAVLRQSQEVGQIGSYSLNVARGTFSCSDTMNAIFGLPPSFEKTYANWLQIISVADRDAVSKAMEEAIVQGTRFSYEYKIVRPVDGKECWIQAFGEIKQDESDQSSHLVGIVLDTTERRQHEEELLKAKEMAEAANIAKSLFLASMSHEIRTPMNGILGMTELTLDTNLNREQRQYLDLIKSSADSLLTIIDDILDSSKIEAGKLLLENVVFDLATMLDDAVKTLVIPAEQKGLELVADTDIDSSHTLIGDPVRIRQILFNIVGNAIKFTESGEVVIQVRQEVIAGGEVLLHFKVTDTGIGIEQSKIASIFDSFSQADNSITRKYGGTGLGLSISSRLVKMMQGRIWVESELEHGSTFHFVIRLIKGELSQVPPLVCLPERKVLVVDDSTANRQFLSDTFLKLGLNPVCAETGQEALDEMLRAQHGANAYDLILIDAHMPGMDGFALQKKIAEIRPPISAKVIMMISAGIRGDADRCHRAGIEFYMSKPIRLPDLRSTLVSALDMDSDNAVHTALVVNPVPSSVKRLSILLVEDNLINQQLAVRLLEKSGHSVKVRDNGRDAMSLIETEKFDVVLMDVQMPVMDGIEACLAIRAREKLTGEHLPVIAMTANVMEGDRERCLAAGMDDYISKPIQSKKLLDCIESVLNGNRISQLLDDHSADVLQAVPEFDYARALEKTDVEVLDIVGKLALTNIPAQIVDIASSLHDRHLSDIQRAAHTLKGVIGYFGATPIVEHAKRIELSAKQGELDEAQRHFQLLEVETRKFLVHLTNKLGTCES
ncbi:response regulator [Undibacterium sp. TC4M20W]|uniref:response regulator n=1 Tax=Undibacterium sp. TC4M20W TaxID=3413052 RepID=UPI003BF10246